MKQVFKAFKLSTAVTVIATVLIFATEQAIALL